MEYILAAETIIAVAGVKKYDGKNFFIAKANC
jgi:hypothetical protein